MPTLGGLTGSLLVFDKDGVLLDFHRRWSVVTRARSAALVNFAAGRLEAVQTERLLGLDVDDRVAPAGLLACGSRAESALAAATLLHQAGFAWPTARAAAGEAFDRADASVDFAETSRPLPGVPQALRALALAGWRFAVATSDETEQAREFLEISGMAEHFIALVGADRVRQGKPNPEMFRLVCKEAGVSPGDAIMVGDLDIDLLMGRSAGAAGTIGVLSGIGDEGMLLPHADFVVRDVSALAALTGTGAQ